MRRIRHLTLLLVLGIVVAIPGAGRAGGGDCPGSLCASANTAGDGAWADWNGGHVDYWRGESTHWRGGVSVQNATDSWVNISRWDPFNGQNNYNCGYGPLPAGAVTENPDGSVTLAFQHPQDPNCYAYVTWTPTQDLEQSSSGFGSRFDPNTGSFDLNAGVGQGRPATASGSAAGAMIDPYSVWAEMQSGSGVCVTNSGCF